MSLIDRIKTAQVRAAERAVIDSIPADLMAHMKRAQADYEAKGGCPGCGHMVLACHYADCKVCADDIY